VRNLTSALVLGGAGFLGRWVVAELVQRHIKTALVDLPGQQPDPSIAGVDVIEADVDELDVQSLVEDRAVDALFHLVGTAFVPASISDPVADLQRNAGITLKLLRQVQALERPPILLFVSSAAVYGNGRRMPMDEDHPFDPVSPYGVSKLAAERYVRVYAQLHGLTTLSVRPFSLYGPGQRKLVIYDMFKRIHAGEDPLIVSAPREVARDFVFCEDAARSIVTLAERAEGHGEAYNIAHGTATTLDELVATILEVTGVGAEVRFTGELRPGDPERWFGDPTRAGALGARCTTSLKDGLSRTNEWFLATHDVDRGGS